MRSAAYRRPGNPADVIEIIDRTEPPAPRAGQLLVSMRLAPMHPGDLLLGDPDPAVHFQARPIGSEGVGIVQAVGDGVESFAPGDRVAVFPAPGAFSGSVLVRAVNSVPVPPEITDAVAALMLINSITAREILRAAESAGGGRAGQAGPLVVAAAASSVGRLVVAEARERGLEVIAVVRSEASAAQLAVLFPGIAVVRTGASGWREELDGLVGRRPVQVAIDAHGGPFTRDLLTVVAPGGTVLVFGDLSRTDTGITAFDFVPRGVGIRGVSIGRWFARGTDIQDSDRSAAVHFATRWPHLFESAGTFDLEAIQEAVAAAQSRGKRGTPLVQIGQDTTSPGGTNV